MGIRGELFSTKVQLPNRTYFFNVKENRVGDIYLNIVESRNKEGGGFDRASLCLFDEDADEFLGGLEEAMKEMRKNSTTKRKSFASERKSNASKKKVFVRKSKGFVSKTESKAGDRRDRKPPRKVVKKITTQTTAREKES